MKHIQALRGIQNCNSTIHSSYNYEHLKLCIYWDWHIQFSIERKLSYHTVFITQINEKLPSLDNHIY
jgi:hypothetical protein